MQNIKTYEKYLKNSNSAPTVEFWNKRAYDFNERHKDAKEDSFVFSTLDKLEILKKNFKVLDIGCGVGRHSKSFIKRTSSYLGIDTSNKMIEFAKENIKEENINFKVFNYEELKDTYDVVFQAMCPAFDSIESIKKFSELSNKYLVMHRFLKEEDNISHLIDLEYLNKAHNNSNYVYGLINILWLLGYFPQIITKTETTTQSFNYDNFLERYDDDIKKLSKEKYNYFKENIKKHLKDKKIVYEKTALRSLIIWQKNIY